MSCEEIQEQIVLLAYEELGEDGQAALELHLHGCTACRAEMEGLGGFVRQMSADTLPEISPNLLAQSRLRLDDTLENVSPGGVFQRAFSLLSGSWRTLQSAPALATLLIGIGFLSGDALHRYQANHEPKAAPAVSFYNQTEGVIGNISGVVQTPNSNIVQVKYNRIVPETMQGSLADPQIRQLLMTAAKGSDKGVREESVSLLANECLAGHQCEHIEDGQGFRDALLVSLRYDKSPQVRLRALDGLRPFIGLDQRVRDAVLESLMRDPSASVRTRAIGMIEPVQADSSVRQVLHTVSTQDDNQYIRNASMQALEHVDGIQ